jgi:hypothetical protein
MCRMWSQILHHAWRSDLDLTNRLFGWPGGWCWFVLREEYCWPVAGGWFDVREKYCWLVADKPSEQCVSLHVAVHLKNQLI